MEKKVVITSKLNLIIPEKGGRKDPIFSECPYRPYIVFSSEAISNCSITFINKKKICPGESVLAEIVILFPERLEGYLRIGQAFKIVEPEKDVAKGEILQISE